MSAKKEKTIEQLEKDLQTAELNLNNPTISGNPGLLASTKKRIALIKERISEMKKGAPKPAAAKPTKPAKAEKPAKADKPKKQSSSGGKFEIGDKVRFFLKSQQKEVTGEITYHHKTKQTYTVVHKYGTSYPKVENVEAA